MNISKKLRDAIENSDQKKYEIAKSANLHYSTLSQLINGIAPINEDDKRIIAIGKVVGLKPEECFE